MKISCVPSSARASLISESPSWLVPLKEKSESYVTDSACFQYSSVLIPVLQNCEVVFNTSMTGYQEILTDPSYSRQIVTLTYPHIGNYGCNEEDEESPKIHPQGLVIRDLPLLASNFRSQSSLSDYLVKHNVEKLLKKFL